MMILNLVVDRRPAMPLLVARLTEIWEIFLLLISLRVHLMMRHQVLRSNLTGVIIGMKGNLVRIVVYQYVQ